jgi:hypothetical protein
VNAKRPSKSDLPPTEDVPPGTMTDLDPLEPYRTAMADLQSVVEKRTTLLSLQTDLEGQLARLEVDREAALSRASQTDELAEEEADALVRITTKAEILRRKQSDVAKRLEAAEVELALLQSDVAYRFSSLWRAFFQWKRGEAQKEIEAQLVPGMVAPHILEQLARAHKSVQPVHALDITSADAELVTERAGRLLEAISVSGWSDVPAWQPQAPVAPAEEPIGLPWDDGTGQLQIELKKLEVEGATLADIFVRLKARCPHFFKSQAEVMKMLNPLAPLETGVYETRAPMIGSTVLEPTEEQFSHAH